MLYRARRTFLGIQKTSFKSLKDVKLPDKLLDNFFLFDEGEENKILIFGSPLAKQYLKIHLKRRRKHFSKYIRCMLILCQIHC